MAPPARAKLFARPLGSIQSLSLAQLCPNCLTTSHNTNVVPPAQFEARQNSSTQIQTTSNNSIYDNVCMYICIYVSMYLCIYVYMYIWYGMEWNGMVWNGMVCLMLCNAMQCKM